MDFIPFLKNKQKKQLHLTVDAFILSLVDTVFLDVLLGCCPGFKDPSIPLSPQGEAYHPPQVES